MFDVVHLCVERDPVRVATGLAVAGLAMAGLAAAGPAVAGLAVAGLVAAGLAEAGLVEQRAVHLHGEEDAVVVGRVEGEPDKVSGKDVGHGGSGATEPILYLVSCVGRLLLPLAVQRAVPPVPPHDENEKRMRKGTRRVSIDIINGVLRISLSQFNYSCNRTPITIGNNQLNKNMRNSKISNKLNTSLPTGHLVSCFNMKYHSQLRRFLRSTRIYNQLSWRESSVPRIYSNQQD